MKLIVQRRSDDGIVKTKKGEYFEKEFAGTKKLKEEIKRLEKNLSGADIEIEKLMNQEDIKKNRRQVDIAKKLKKRLEKELAGVQKMLKIKEKQIETAIYEMEMAEQTAEEKLKKIRMLNMSIEEIKEMEKKTLEDMQREINKKMNTGQQVIDDREGMGFNNTQVQKAYNTIKEEYENQSEKYTNEERKVMKAILDGNMNEEMNECE